MLKLQDESHPKAFTEIWMQVNSCGQTWDRRHFHSLAKVATGQEQKLVSSYVGHFIIFFLNVFQNCTLKLHYLNIPNLYGIQVKRAYPKTLSFFASLIISRSFFNSQQLPLNHWFRFPFQSMNLLFISTHPLKKFI